MKTANRHNQALGALDPSTIQVDERTVLDHLNFAASFGGLINFYDKHNQKNGSWRPFFLKDPVILLSAISKTDYTSKHLLFLLLGKKLETLDWTVGHLEQLAPTPETPQHNRLLEQLFTLIQSLFIDINDWLLQMENNQQSYQLKDFIYKSVGEKLSPLLWQFLALKRTASQICPEIATPDYPLFTDFHTLWRSTVNNAPTKFEQDANLFVLTQQVYRPVFSFYMQVIDSAKHAFLELKGKNISPPDTALLIAFVELMSVQQRQLNQLTEKHLNFYYRDILKQRNKAAQADDAYLCLTLKKDAEEFNLPAGTEFKAGLDEQQQPIIFASTHAQILNRIALKQVKTLRYDTAAEPTGHKLFLNITDAPTAISKDTQGQVLSWPLFGADSGVEIKQGFAFASPMLDLQNGERKLGICFECDKEIPDNYFAGCDVYLSTEKEWLKTPFEQKRPEPSNNQLCLIVNLTNSDPAISRFAKNPDGYDSEWPLFKLVLSDSVDLTQPPRLKKLTITVEVDQFRAFELCNDNGKLDGNSPFLPFGPVPVQGDNFYLGSAELFAKPLTRLALQVSWDQLPESMTAYYQQYNEFLNKSSQPTDTVCPIVPFNNTCFKVGFYFWRQNQWQLSTVDHTDSFEAQVDDLCNFAVSGSLTDTQKTELCDAINAVLQNQMQPPLTPETIGTAQISLANAITNRYAGAPDKLERFLADIETKMGASYPLKTYENLVSLFQIEQNQSATPKPPAEPAAPVGIAGRLKNGLKLLSRSKPAEPPVVLPPLTSSSVFEFSKPALDNIAPAPGLLLQPLDFSGPQKTGFLNIKLQQPVYGFGNNLYGQVIMDVTQQNAYKMTQAVKANETFVALPMPNQPYAPKIARLALSYSAEHCVDFADAATDNYPFEFYHYDTFSSYPVYDRLAPAGNLISRQRQAPGLASADHDSIPLFSGIDSLACLYLKLDNVQPPCQLSLYFVLTDFAAPVTDGKPPAVAFYYLGINGWQTLKILADDTNSLRCSGIIEFMLPGDISPSNPLMPESGYWLAVTSNHPATDFPGVVYLNTQAVKVKRVNPQGLAAPHIDAGIIKEAVTPVAQIDALSQPFASLNGLGAEDDQMFFQRVSQRIKTKDRCSSRSDFEIMAFDAVPGLYFCKLIDSRDQRAHPGEVKLGLVNGYTSLESPDAFRPIVTGCNIGKAYRYFAGRTSPFVRLNLFNLSHESVRIEATLKFAVNTPINRLSQQIAQQLKIYLSPWIQSELPQIAIDEGLSSAAIIDYLTRYPEVDSVCSLKLTAGTRQVTDNFVIFPEQPEGLFVSAPSHEISAAV
ncbi:MAG: hypothetical protein ACXWF8_13350 [Methylobacter sp.]